MRELEVIIKDKTYLFKKYDKIGIPGNITHSAVAGKERCTFFLTEK